MRVNFFGWALIFILIIGTMQEVDAWNQGTHRQINYEAVNLFLSQMDGKEKFKLGPITEKLRMEPYRGIAVTSSGRYVKDYQIAPGNYTMPQWITLGGDWADEPHLYASLRHFYDPFSRVKSYLTDQWLVHGVLYESPGINAKTWGLDHPDNPFSFKQGLIYYKLAMEVAEDIPLQPMLSQSHFKLNLNLAPVDHADQRRTYLAFAYRSLGETMHMLGDMTQPAHVRNDAHPLDEPIETRVFSEHVRKAAADRLLDPRITPFLDSAGGGLQWPEQLFDVVAAFTNKYFYSADTIYDQPSDVIPNNYDLILARPYSEPQFADLKERHTLVKGYLIERRVKRYEGQGGAFDWMIMPMAQERLTFHWFDPDQTIWYDYEEAAGRLGGKQGRYHIPNAYAPDQARVLLPIAIYANADLMDMFFPTLELKAVFKEEGIQAKPQAKKNDDYRRHLIHIDSEMIHHQQHDTAWSEYKLLIEYTGPATLVISKDGKPVRKRTLHFKKGKLDKIEMSDGSLKQKDLELYSPLGERDLDKEEDYYRIDNLEMVHVEIEAGTRLFQSESWTFEKDEPTVTILPPRLITYEMAGGANEVTHQFEAVGRPDDRYRFEWDFGDGKTFVETKQPGQTSLVSHTYKNLKDGDVFLPKVTLYLENGPSLASDAIRIVITAQGNESPYDYDCGWSPDYSRLEVKEDDYGHRIYHIDPNNGYKRHGINLQWYDNSRAQLREAICYYENSVHGMMTTWHSNGNVDKIIHFQHGTLHGSYTTFYYTGIKGMETNYTEGLEQGVRTEYFGEGQVRRTTLLKDGLQDGPTTTYDEKGNKLLEVNFRNGKRHGPSTWWNEAGKKTMEQEYNNGQKHGKYNTYYDGSGNLQWTGAYEYDQAVGTWTWYNDDGTIRSQVHH